MCIFFSTTKVQQAKSQVRSVCCKKEASSKVSASNYVKLFLMLLHCLAAVLQTEMANIAGTILSVCTPAAKHACHIQLGKREPNKCENF